MMPEFLKAKRLEVFVIVSIIAVIGIVYALTQKPAMAPTISSDQNQSDIYQDQNSVQLVPSGVVMYQGVEGKNALELLKQNHRVETQEFASIGEFVKSIDGVAPDSTHFWAFYLNGQQAQVGAGAYMTKNSDVIEWKLEEIKM
jgi:hypothetical protein